MTQLAEAARIVRKELLIRDQPLKAYELLEKLNLPELQKELDLTKSAIAHVFDKERYKKYYSEELQEDPNPTFYKRFEWVMKKLQEDVKENVEKNTEGIKTIIDLGCADGTLVDHLNKMGWEATGVNLHKASIEYAKKTYKGTFICDDVFNIKGNWDLVIAFEILEHIPEDKAFIDHCAELSNGWVYLCTPDGPVLDGEGNKESWEHRGDGVRGHIRVYNEQTLRNLLEGYEIGELTHDVDNGVKYLYARYKKT